MSDRVNAEKSIRKSIEEALTTVVAEMRQQVPSHDLGWGNGEVYGPSDAPRFPIWWPNQTFYAAPAGTSGDSKPPYFVRVSHHPAPPRPRTIGRNPRVLMSGHTLIGCHIPEGAGEDLIDNLANAVMSAYPYGGVFSRDGFDTFIDNLDPKPAHAALGRFYKPVHINWNCWRTSS